MAHRLLAHELAGAQEPAAVAAALQRLCTRVAESLRRSVGEDGFSALLTRALSRVEAEHAALKDIRRFPDGRVALDGVAASVDRFGAPAVTAAIESLLEALVDLLSSLIGADMVMSLLDWNGSPQPNNRRTQ
jgi:predicted ArsR family transcriptional regulator